MLRRVLIKSRRWFGRAFLGQTQIQKMSPLERQRRIRKLDRQKLQFKDRMDGAMNEYDKLIGEAGQ